MSDLLKEVLTAKRETNQIEFKQQFSVASTRDCCEVIKDIVALANSGGGIIPFGVDDGGVPTIFDPRELLAWDSADITNKIFSYTGCQFSVFDLGEVAKDGYTLAFLRVGPASIPMVFTRPGAYQDEVGRQKSAFNVGTLYFRHGAKSEPAVSDDLRLFLDREIKQVRSSWLKGIRKVVEAPPDAQVVLVASKSPSQSAVSQAVRITADPNAPSVNLKEEDLRRRYPLDYRALTRTLRKLYADFIENQQYHTFRKSLEGDPRYCWTRLLDPPNPKSPKKRFYSRAVLKEFDKHYKRKAA